MHRWSGIVIALALLCSGIAPGYAQEPVSGRTMITGVLTSIKGDVYLMQEISGRFGPFEGLCPLCLSARLLFYLLRLFLGQQVFPS